VTTRRDTRRARADNALVWRRDRATTYSQYKGQTTVKFNVGLAANGLIDYILDADFL